MNSPFFLILWRLGHQMIRWRLNIRVTQPGVLRAVSWNSPIDGCFNRKIIYKWWIDHFFWTQTQKMFRKKNCSLTTEDKEPSIILRKSLLLRNARKFHLSYILTCMYSLMCLLWQIGCDKSWEILVWRLWSDMIWVFSDMYSHISSDSCSGKFHVTNFPTYLRHIDFWSLAYLGIGSTSDR